MEAKPYAVIAQSSELVAALEAGYSAIDCMHITLTEDATRAIVRSPMVTTVAIQLADLPMLAEQIAESGIKRLIVNSRGTLSALMRGLLLLLRADQLESLVIECTQLEARHYEVIACMSRLRQLTISYCSVGLEIEELSANRTLETLDLTHTIFEGCNETIRYAEWRLQELRIGYTGELPAIDWGSPWPRVVVAHRVGWPTLVTMLPNPLYVEYCGGHLALVTMLPNPLYAEYWGGHLALLMGHLPAPLAELVREYAASAPAHAPTPAPTPA